MATCPNKNTEAWQLLVTSRGEDVAHYLWDKYDGLVPESESKTEIVKTGLKATNILQSPKADQFFNAVTKNKISGDFFWKKMQADLGIPKDQIEILKSFDTQDRGELISSLLANYSYAVEINIAKDVITDQYERFTPVAKKIENFEIASITGGNVGQYFVEFINTDGDPDIRIFETKAEADNAVSERRTERPSQVYSNLTVPGGTNYTENEIATPAITPSIKGHAQFATDKGIGWFRSDDKVSENVQVENQYEYYDHEAGEERAGDRIGDTRNDVIIPKDKFTYNGDTYERREPLFDEEDFGTISYFKNGKAITGKEFGEAFDAINQPTKTRRILEVQSDLFQKGRDKKDLVTNRQEKSNGYENSFTLGNRNYFHDSYTKEYWYNENGKNNFITFEEYKKAHEEMLFGEGKIKSSENQFLQLLNQGSNWVTFFVKSIVQDSAKKGYEKVLFPSGDTASKVEGHTTLEEFKKQKEDRLKYLENKEPWKGRIKKIDNAYVIEEFYNGKWLEMLEERYYSTEEQAKQYLKKFENKYDDTTEINQLKQELERIEGPEGFGALKPIYNFYENTVKNVLNKQYGKENVKQVTDEYGNTWNEIEIVPEREQQSILLQKPTGKEQKASPKLISLMKEFIKSIGVDYKLVTDVVYNGQKVDANGAALIMQKLIQVVEGKEDVALPEEAMHFAVEIIKQTNPKLYQQLLKEINGHPVLQQVVDLYGNDPRYQLDGKRNYLKLKEEAIAQVLAGRLEDVLARTWWDKIVDFLKGLFSQRSGIDQASLDVLSGKIASVEDIDVSKVGVYFQLNEGEKVFNNMVNTSNQIQEVDGGYELNGVKSIRRVSDFAKEFYESVFKDIGKTDFEKALFDLKSEKGTAGHADIEYAFKMLVDPTTGLLREEKQDDSDYTSQLNPRDRKMYEILRDNLNDRLQSFGEGTRFLSEVKIFDSKRKIGGKVDFVAIKPDGKVSILDWKFMDLNTDKYEDVPWYKVRAWNIQMSKYKDIISTSYGVKNEDFQQTRMIPILAKYSMVDYEKEILPRLLEIKIGDANIQNIEEDFLLPVGIVGEKTGEKRVDTLISKLNSVYKKLSEERVSESEKSAKAEQLNALYKAIRHLQIKGNVVPLINQAKILNKQVSMLLNKYDAEFKGKQPSEVDQEKINAFAGMIRIHLEALQPYLDLDQLRFLLKEDTEDNKKLKTSIIETVQNVKDYIYELNELDEIFGEKFNNTSSTPEKVVKGIAKWFSSTATLQVANIQSLYKLANRAFFLSNQETLEEVKKLNNLKSAYDKWASSKGLSIRNYFDIITKKDKNELIDQYDRQFYDELKSKIAKKDFNWILDNVNQDLYRSYVEDKIEEETSRIFSIPRVGTEEEVKAIIKRELAKLYSRYDLQNRNSNGWLLYDEIKQFPKIEKWQSKEWEELIKPENAPAKAFYDYIVERNKYYQSIGYLNGKAARKFLPWIRKGFVEGLVFDGKTRGLGEQFLRDISMDEGEAGYGQTDPVTGELINTIPRYFTKDLGEGYSTDLFKTMALYNQYAIKFKNLKDIEESSLQLLRAERNKKSIMSSTFGKMIIEDGAPKLNEKNDENSKLLEDMIKGIVYQQQYVQSEVFDVALGKISGFGKNINNKLGMKIFPEDLDSRQLSLNKALSTLNTKFQLSTLGLNALSSMSNYFGGSVHGIINAGTYFTKLDIIKTQMWFLENKMKGKVFGKDSLGESPKKALAALDYFLPFIENYNRDAAKKLSINKLDEQAIQDFLMVMMRKGEDAIQTVNFFTFLKNAVVIDGEIVNVRQYLKTTDEYKSFYSGTKEERKARADKFEKDVEALLDEKGVLQLGEVNSEGEFSIPGIDKKSDSVMNFRRLVQSFTSDALGSMSEENRRLVNMNVYTSSAMVFKNWIPRLVDVRIGDIKYNAASDAYEWGRMRMIFGLLTTDILKSINSLKSAIGGDSDAWLNQVRDLYEKKRQEYFDNTGKDLDMTEDEFIDLVNQNMKNQAMDLVILLSMMSLLAGLKAAAPDDDEDPIVKNQWKFYLKATDKLTDELMYFYKPTTPFDLISGKGGVFPALGLLENYVKFTTNFAAENFGIIIENEKMQDDAKPIKYLMRSFPISNQAAGYLPMFYPELAKDLGIKMQSQYGMR